MSEASMRMNLNNWPAMPVFLLSLVAVTVTGRINLAADTFYVSTNGSDSHAGTESKPFRTIRKAVDVMPSHSTCYVRKGVYREAVTGTIAAGVKIMAHPGEEVTLDGTEAISELQTNGWTLYKGSIYKTRLSKHIWQLFVDGEMMIPARWPNASLDDDTIWDREKHWAHGNESADLNGVMVDDPHHDVDLAALNIDATGAMAIMNIGSWKTATREVSTHTARSNTFTYDPVTFTYKTKHHYYYLECKLNLLDAEKEWHYDPASRTLYLWAPGGGSPGSNVRGKTQSYAFNVEESDYIHLKGLNFFATTFRFYNCKNVTIEDCDLAYPSCSKRMLGSIDGPEVTIIDQNNSSNPSSCSVINCSIENTDSHAIYMSGGNDRIENCSFRNIDFSVSQLPGLMTSIYMMGANSVFRRNTVSRTGASSTLALGDSPVVELNRVWNTGYLQSDGSITQVTIGAQPGSQVRYNWFHDTVKSGARFDAPIPPTRWGNSGTMRRNVVWNAGSGLMIKGQRHYCLNNTCLACSSNGIIILDDSSSGGGGNAGTVTRNNISDELSGHRKRYVPVPGICDHNWNGYETGKGISTQLRDPDNLDFRPKPGAQIIDAGTTTPGDSDSYLGEAPDIGAYEYGCDHYWIGGRRRRQASTPVPPDRAGNVKRDAGLMWLEAYKAASHNVFFGTDCLAVTNADDDAPEFMGNQTNNIYDPGILAPNTTCYWRIDALDAGGNAKSHGNVWSFTTR